MARKIAQTGQQAGPSPLRTASGLPLKTFYSCQDRTARTEQSEPGTFPFTRGIRQKLYQDELWVMGQYSGYSSPEETNRRIRKLIAQGQRGFSIALDLPTQMGLDSDHPLSRGEVGRVGVPINSVRDVVDLLKDIPLDRVRQIRTSANSIGPVALAFLVSAAEQLGYEGRQFRVMLQNDPLKEYVARGTFIFPPRRALQFAVDVIEYCAGNLSNWEPIEFCGYHIRDSGADAVQEVAIAMGNAIEYIEATLRRGLAIDDFAHTLFMFLSAHIDLFEEVAKFRAARLLWARLMRERFGATREESWKLNLFVYTLGSQLTRQEPLNNVARVAYEALAAVLGGVQTLATSSFDEALGLPTEDAVRVSLRTQQILAYETGITRVTDPLGGSYYVEELTSEFAAAVQRYMALIEEQGGALAALESGWIGAQIDDSAYRQQKAIENGDQPLVGVNMFRQENTEGTIRAMVMGDQKTEERQLARLAELRATRDGASVERALAGVREAAERDQNTVPAIISAARAEATLGEICGALKEIWGEYRQQW